MAFKFNSIALLLSSLLTGGGAWLGYELYKPRTVDALVSWKGLKLASESDDNIWKALYYQGKPKLGDQIKDAVALKKECVKLSKEKLDYSNKNFEFVERFCLDVLKTRKARIIATGFKEEDFLDKEEDFKVAFTFNRYSESFLGLLGGKLSEESEIEGDDKSILDNYKNYCKDALQADDRKIKVVQQVCSKKHYRKAKDKLKHDGYELKSQKELRDEWEKHKNPKKSDQYREGSTLLEDIKPRGNGYGEDSWIKLQEEQDLFAKQFNDWCQKQNEKDLFEKDFYKNIYPRFKTRCAKEILKKQ